MLKLLLNTGADIKSIFEHFQLILAFRIYHLWWTWSGSKISRISSDLLRHRIYCCSENIQLEWKAHYYMGGTFISNHRVALRQSVLSKWKRIAKIENNFEKSLIFLVQLCTWCSLGIYLLSWIHFCIWLSLWLRKNIETALELTVMGDDKPWIERSGHSMGLISLISRAPSTHIRLPLSSLITDQLDQGEGRRKLSTHAINVSSKPVLRSLFVLHIVIHGYRQNL